MKKILQLLLLLLFSILSSESSMAQSKKIEKAEIQSNFYCDHCKKCETCGQNFEANLRRVKGVKDFELNEAEMTLTVYYNTKKTTLSTIRKEITLLGFDADSLKADSAAYERLDNCCKK